MTLDEWTDITLTGDELDTLRAYDTLNGLRQVPTHSMESYGRENPDLAALRDGGLIENEEIDQAIRDAVESQARHEYGVVLRTQDHFVRNNLVDERVLGYAINRDVFTSEELEALPPENSPETYPAVGEKFIMRLRDKVLHPGPEPTPLSDYDPHWTCPDCH